MKLDDYKKLPLSGEMRDNIVKIGDTGVSSVISALVADEDVLKNPFLNGMEPKAVNLDWHPDGAKMNELKKIFKGTVLEGFTVDQFKDLAGAFEKSKVDSYSIDIGYKPSKDFLKAFENLRKELKIDETLKFPLGTNELNKGIFDNFLKNINEKK